MTDLEDVLTTGATLSKCVRLLRAVAVSISRQRILATIAAAVPIPRQRIPACIAAELISWPQDESFEPTSHFAAQNSPLLLDSRPQDAQNRRQNHLVAQMPEMCKCRKCAIFADMKKLVYTLVAAAIVLTAASCNQNNVLEEGKDQQNTEQPDTPHTPDTPDQPEAPDTPDTPDTLPTAEPIEYYEQCLFRPGDYGSTNWRIPAICCLPDGTLLITCDRRKYNETDLPEDIDIVSRRSTDNGRTWSEPVTIAEGTGRKQGFGDAALVVCENGDVVCVFVGGNGLFASSESDPIRSYVCRSTDGGQSWSAPQDITAQLWGSQATNTVCRNYRASFFGSGNGLRLTRGQHAGPGGHGDRPAAGRADHGAAGTDHGRLERRAGRGDPAGALHRR